MRSLTLLLLLVLGEFSEVLAQRNIPFIKGIYGDPGSLLAQGHSFREMGVNAIFVRSVSLNPALYEAAYKEGVRLFVEFPTLNGKEYLAEHPDAWPIDENGQKAKAADWFMGICPTHPGFKAYRESQLKSILSNYTVDGIWLDYLHWHAQFETPEPILPETCFCNRCTSLFSSSCSVDLPEGDEAATAQFIKQELDATWRRWRSEVLNEWVRSLKQQLTEAQPDALLGIFYCSWYPADYDSALYRTLGIDLQSLAKIADVFSPMLYHERKGKPLEWVAEYTSWLAKQEEFSTSGSPLIWPIVQANDIPGKVSPEDFRKVMEYGMQPPSTGIMMFSESALYRSPAKLRVMKSLYINH